MGGPYYDALRVKWAGLAGNAEERLAAINTMAVPGPQMPVPISTVMGYLRRHNLWMGIKVRSSLPLDDPNFSVGAWSAVDLNEDRRITTIDFTLPIVAQMLAEMVNKRLLTQQQSDDLVGLSETEVPWWQASVEQGGGGLRGPVAKSDLEQAGLIDVR